MKNMPGMGNIQSMLNKMGFAGKMNTGGMEAQMNKNMKQALNKERMRAKAEALRQAKEQQSSAAAQSSGAANNSAPGVSDEELTKIFSTGEKVERTPRGAPKPNSNNGKKKKGKK
jgi:predicted flap endonuclease-1-like 5' DNA nuclease